MEIKSCKEYRDLAWNSLEGKWMDAVVIALLVAAINCIGSGMSIAGSLGQMSLLSMVGESTSFIVGILVGMPLSFAFAKWILSVVRQQETNGEGILETIIHAITHHYTPYVVAGALMILVIVGIGIITLGIGAIIFAFAYAMVPYILNDHPEMSAKEALHASRMMMRGHKWDLFVLYLSFIGWWILCILSCGIGFLWVSPYVNAATAHFYEDIKQMPE